MSRKRLFGLIALPLLIVALSGCILTLGAPLARKVEPDSWVLEGGAGMSSFGTPGPSGYFYLGRSLGPYFELGILPYAYMFGDGLSFAVNVPLRWDPFPHEWPFHLIPFAGPTAYGGTTNGAGLTTGAAASWQPLPWLELAATASTLVPYVQFFTVSGGARISMGDWRVGAHAMYTVPGLIAAMVSAGIVLGEH